MTAGDFLANAVKEAVGTMDAVTQELIARIVREEIREALHKLRMALDPARV